MTSSIERSEIWLETAYLPPVSWLHAALRADVIRLEACENYQKGGWRNRCHIAGPNGLQRLSIPLEKGKHQQTPIREVRFSTAENWALSHWRSIQTAYGNAPFFEFYADELEQLLLRPGTDRLFDFNAQLIEWLFRKLRLPARIEFSTHWAPPSELPCDLRGNRKLETDLTRFKPYPQVFTEKHGFLANLSTLDLLMCRGREVEDLIR